MKYLIIEHHPNDSRERLSTVCQALNSRMGTGGGNVPLVVMIDESDYKRNKSCKIRQEH